MLNLLCVLLYLVLITSPNTYTEQYIYDTESANQAQVDQVESDPVLYPQVIAEYMDEAELIVVSNPEED